MSARRSSPRMETRVQRRNPHSGAVLILRCCLPHLYPLIPYHESPRRPPISPAVVLRWHSAQRPTWSSSLPCNPTTPSAPVFWLRIFSLLYCDLLPRAKSIPEAAQSAVGCGGPSGNVLALKVRQQLSLRVGQYQPRVSCRRINLGFVP